MKLLLLVLIYIPYLANGQQSFEYRKMASGVYLKGSHNSIMFYPYEKKDSKVRERKVFAGGVNYRFVISRTHEGYRQELLDRNNTVMATTWLSGKKKYMVVLPDSSHCSMFRPDNLTWIYLNGTKIMMRSTYQKASGKKSLLIDEDPASPNHLALQLICLERGTDQIIKRSKSGRMIVVAICAGFMSAIMNSSQH